VVAGDGGFQMTAAELTTCAQEGLKINIAIINNGYLGMVRAVAGVLLQPPLRRHRRCAARLRPAGAGARLTGLRVTRRERSRTQWRAPRRAGSVVVEFRVEQEDSV